jgi:chemotaxis protein histidine kinase CheA
MNGLKKIWLLFCGILLCLPWAARPQDFAPIYENLNRLDALMIELRESNESMNKDNESLNVALGNLDELLKTQGELLAEQRKISEEAREISRRQAELLAASLSKSKRLTISLIIGIPAAASLGILTGVILGRH